jgi:hypothetical protein
MPVPRLSVNWSARFGGRSDAHVIELAETVTMPVIVNVPRVAADPGMHMASTTAVNRISLLLLLIWWFPP